MDKKKRREEPEERLKPCGADEYEGFIEFDEDFDREMAYAQQESIRV